MPSLSSKFLSLIERSVRFEFHEGASTWVTHPHTTGWRVLPSLVVAQIDSEATIERPDAKPLKVRRGQAFAVVPGQMHCVTKTNRRPGFSHWSHTQCEIFQGVSLFYLIEPPQIVSGRRSVEIGRINRALARIAGTELSLASVLRRQTLGWQLITTLVENIAVTEERLDLVRSASRLTPVLAYIEENLSRPISHELLARTAGLSPSRFHVLFRAALGSAPYEYVQKLRLKKAQQLLVRTDRSIAEIGQDVGHPDPYHFSRVFRRSIGVSPKGYRTQAISRSL